MRTLLLTGMMILTTSTALAEAIYTWTSTTTDGNYTYSTEYKQKSTDLCKHERKFLNGKELAGDSWSDEFFDLEQFREGYQAKNIFENLNTPSSVQTARFSVPGDSPNQVLNIEMRKDGPRQCWRVESQIKDGESEIYYECAWARRANRGYEARGRCAASGM